MIMNARYMPFTAALLAITALGATASPALAKKQPRPSGFEPALPVEQPMQPQVATGGIFNVAAGYAPLYTGTRAARIGDPVTILLVESTTASKSVNSKSQKGGGLSITPPTAGPLAINPTALNGRRSEERRVGKECVRRCR